MRYLWTLPKPHQLKQLQKIYKQIDASNQKALKDVRSFPADSCFSAKQNLMKSEQYSYEKGIAASYLILGASYTWLADYEKALVNCYKAIDLLREQEEYEQEVEAIYYIALIFYLLKDNTRVLEYAHKSLDLSQDISYRLGEANALNILGTAYYTMGENEDALEKFNEAIHIAKTTDDYLLKGRIFESLGRVYINLNVYDKAVGYMQLAHEASGNKGVKEADAYSLKSLGDAYCKLKEYPKALVYYKQSFDIYNDLKFYDGMGALKISIAEIYFRSKDLNKSMKSYSSALKIGNKSQSYESIYKANFGLAELYRKQDNVEKHLEHFKAFHIAEKEYLLETKELQIRAIELKNLLDQIKKNKAILEDHFKDVKLLNTIIQTIASVRNLDSIFNLIHKSILQLTNADGIFIGFCNYEKRVIEIQKSFDKGKEVEVSNFRLDKENLPAFVVNNNIAVMLNDYENEILDYIDTKEPIIGSQPNSLIQIPLVLKQKVIGLLSIKNNNKNAFSKRNFIMLKTFVSYLSLSIENARLFETYENNIKGSALTIEKVHDNSELLNEIGKELVSNLSFENIFKSLYGNVNKLMDATVFGVRLVDETTGKLNYHFEFEKGQRLGKLTLPMTNDNNYSVWCIKNNKEIFINDNLKEYKKYVDEILVVDGEITHSLIFVPLVCNNNVVGVITVQSFNKNAYTPYDLTIVKTLAHYTQLAFANARSYEVLERKVKERTVELDEQNRHITDSIIYAKRIQKAVLPSVQNVAELFPNSFVYLSPKDIVSGDFFWVKEVGDKLIFAVADCTGHGVPGALLSIIGVNCLNQVVNEYEVIDTSEMLIKLNELVLIALQNNENQDVVKDGMDISLCVLDKTTLKLQYSGALNPLYVISDNVLDKWRADRNSIGSMIPNLNYNNHQIQLKKGDVIYLFSDGYADQFGGAKHKKFRYKQFEELLLDIHIKPMEQQKDILKRKIEDWKGELEQTDDICVMGIRI